MRQTREKQIQMLSILPAADIPKYLEDERERAALSIQKAWRGHAVRTELTDRKISMRRARAAIIIQRKVNIDLGMFRSPVVRRHNTGGEGPGIETSFSWDF